MIKITGSIKTFPRGYLSSKDPLDEEVYDLSQKDLKKGKRQIKGLFGAFLNETFIPYGRNGFFYQIPDGSSLGVKVYYSIARHRARLKSNGPSVLKKYTTCYEAEISPKPISLTDVKLDILIDSRKVKLPCWGLIIEKANYPEAALEKFARGELYDFDCLDKDEHIDYYFYHVFFTGTSVWSYSPASGF